MTAEFVDKVCDLLIISIKVSRWRDNEPSVDMVVRRLGLAHNQIISCLLTLPNMAQFIQDIRSVPHPSPANPDSVIVQRGFKITTRKLPILKAGPIESMTANLGITPPEMIFGDNVVSVEHLESGWVIEFNSFDALDRVDKTGGSMLQVAHSKEWQSTRYEGFTELEITAHAEKS